VDFLKALVRHLDQPLLIVWDRLPGHRSRLVQDYIASLRGWISTAYLPSYAPELTKSGRVHLGLLEAARVTQCLPQRLLAPERSSATNATSHAPPSTADQCLLEAIFFVAKLTLYYARVSRFCGKRKWKQLSYRPYFT
jgi:hypothetical protein